MRISWDLLGESRNHHMCGAFQDAPTGFHHFPYCHRGRRDNLKDAQHAGQFQSTSRFMKSVFQEPQKHWPCRVVFRCSQPVLVGQDFQHLRGGETGWGQLCCHCGCEAWGELSSSDATTCTTLRNSVAHVYRCAVGTCPDKTVKGVASLAVCMIDQSYLIHPWLYERCVIICIYVFSDKQQILYIQRVNPALFFVVFSGRSCGAHNLVVSNTHLGA